MKKRRSKERFHLIASLLTFLIYEYDNKIIEKTNLLLVFIRKCSVHYYGIRHKLEDTFKQNRYGYQQFLVDVS